MSYFLKRDELGSSFDLNSIEDVTVRNMLKEGQEYAKQQCRKKNRLEMSAQNRETIPKFSLDQTAQLYESDSSAIVCTNSPEYVSVSRGSSLTQAASKRANESRTEPSISNLKRRLTEKEAELHYSKALNEQLKTSVSNRDPETKIKLIELEKELQMTKDQLKSEKSRTQMLSEKFSKFERQESQLRGTFNEREDELEIEVKKLKARLHLAVKNIAAIESQLQEEKFAKLSMSKAYETEIMQLKSDISVTEDHLKTQKEQFKLLSKTMQEKLEMEKNQLITKYEQETKNLERKLREGEEAEAFVNSMKSNIKQLMEREKEVLVLREINKTLREKQDNTMLLSEKVKTLEEQLYHEKRANNEVVRLSTENHSLKASLSQWEALAKSQGQACSPSAVSSRLALLQQSQLSLKEENGQLHSQLKVAEANQQRTESESKSLKLELEQMKKSLENINQYARKLRHKQLLLSKECESYKRLITSYENEVTMDFSLINKERVATLENLLEEYKNLLNEAGQGPGSNESKNAQLIRDLNAKEAENERLSIQIAELLRNKENESSMQAESGYSGMRVLHFRANPVAMAEEKRQKEMSALKEENEKLKVKLYLLMEKGGDTNLTLESDCQVINPSELKALKEQLQTSEQKNKRLMEAFKRSSSEFREISYLLTGYRIDLIAPKKYKLTHVFAEAPGDHLLFESTDDGKLQLLETDYSKTILPMIEDLLVRQNCIPAFLSTLTLDLYSKQTVTFHSFLTSSRNIS